MRRVHDFGPTPMRAPGYLAFHFLLIASVLLGWLGLCQLDARAARLSEIDPRNGNTLITQENRKAGSSSWDIADASLAKAGEIQAYADETSLNRGGTLILRVKIKTPAADPSYKVEIFRTGWYSGTGARLVMPAITVASPASQPDCPMTANETINGTVVPLNMVECAWTPAPGIALPTSTSDATAGLSGVYLAKLTTSGSQKSVFVPFVVRDDGRNAALIYQASVSTYQAYNDYGGYSLYYPGYDTRSRKVSFNRPYVPIYQIPPYWNMNSAGAGEYFLWEYDVVRFLEKNGYDVVYTTNIDTHRSGLKMTGSSDPQASVGRDLRSIKAFISAGHDEYWSKETYDALEMARNAGVNLIFLGANTAFWQVRYEPDSAGRPLRRMVAYKEHAFQEDPLRATTTITTVFRAINRAEAKLVGVQYHSNSYSGDLVISSCPSWLCRNTGLVSGSRLPGLWGYEADTVFPESPSNVQIIGRTPFTYVDANGVPAQVTGHMTYYVQQPNGAEIFATGSMQFAWGLAPPRFNNRPNLESIAAKNMLHNVLMRFRQ